MTMRIGSVGKSSAEAGNTNAAAEVVASRTPARSPKLFEVVILFSSLQADLFSACLSSCECPDTGLIFRYPDIHNIAF
jgi:hypothetical protein